MQTAIAYVRVSTDGQTTVNQQRELEAVAERHGWTVVNVFKDHAISGKNGRETRPAFDKMLALVPDVKTGSTLTFTYLPGKGTTLQVADKELGLFESKAFADAVFSIWLGPKPPSEDLRKGMLG